MNRVEYKDLEVGQLAWYVVYEGESKPPSQTLVKVLTTDTKLTVQNVRTGETLEPFPVYTYFESVHPQYVENQLKALREQQQRIAAEITVFETL